MSIPDSGVSALAAQPVAMESVVTQKRHIYRSDTPHVFTRWLQKPYTAPRSGSGDIRDL